MTPDIIEGNKLIAGFMGAAIHEKWGSYLDATYYKMHHPAPTNDVKLKPEQISENDIIEKANKHLPNVAYHKSWDWLMPVVEKIKEIPYINFNLSSFDGCAIYDDNYKTTARGKRIASKSETMLESTWQAVVEFIKWHNQNQTK